MKLPSQFYLILLLSIISLLSISGPSPSQENGAPTVIPLQPDFGQPLLRITDEQRQRFEKGKKVFDKIFTPVEGAGPIANEFSCGQCHGAPVVGGSHIRGTVQVVRRFGHREGNNFDPLENLGGSLLQNLSTLGDPCNKETIPPEANVQAVRNTPITFGDGLIEKIPDEDIQAKTTNGGVVHMVKRLEDPQGPLHVGRFGWKAQQATILSFAGDALGNEMGITNDLLPLEQRPNAPAGSPSPCDDGVADPDDRPNAEGKRIIDELQDFLRYLAPPPQTPKSGMRGEEVFKNIGCAVCHIPSYRTPDIPGEPALSNKEVKAYSDFLLHDMGELGDGIKQGDAGPRQMRTSPLWGLRERLGRFPTPDLLHDTSILNQFSQTNVYERVIAAHGLPGSEALQASQNYFNLPSEGGISVQRRDLLNFLDSLGRREFGLYTKQVKADETQFGQFKNCYQDPSQNFDANQTCALYDINQDGKVDRVDLASFMTVYQMPIEDCQCDGIPDINQILDNKATLSECHMNLTILTSFFRENYPLTVRDGVVPIYLDISNINKTEDAKIYYSFSGQGNGPAFGDAICINLKDSIELKNYQRVNDLSLPDASFTADIPVPTGARQISFQIGVLNGGVNTKKSNVVTYALINGDPAKFIRGDANSDGAVDISDPIFLLKGLFQNGPQPKCLDAADANDDGFVDISDAIKILLVKFTNQPMPPPYPNSGPDPTADELGCTNF